MFLFDMFKRSLLRPVLVSCANDTCDQPSTPSTSQDTPSETPHKKCRPRKPKVTVQSDHCQGVKGKQGKTGAGVTGAGGGVAGGGTGDYVTGGGDDRGDGTDKKISKSPKSRDVSPTGKTKSIAKSEPGDTATASGGNTATASGGNTTIASGGNTAIASGSTTKTVDESIKFGSDAGVSDSGVGGKGGKGFSDSGIVDDAGLCLTVDGLPPGSMHPGLLRHLHNGARNRLPSCFEGAFVCVKQSPIQNWIFGHTISFSSVCPGGYKLLSSYVDKDSPGSLPYFVMEAAPGGQVSCEARVPITRGTKATAFAQIANAELYSFETIIDTCFDSFTASLIAVNREFVAMHYLQAITNELCLGAEVSIRGQGPESSSLSAAARYMNEINFLSGTFGSRGLDMCYARAINPALTVAAMLEIGFAVRNAVATLGYEWHASDWTVRASMDSDGLVGCTLHRTFPGRHANFGCAFSALLNHPNDKFRMGFGITATLI